MYNSLYELKRALLTIFGDIKVFKWPLFIVYHPTSFKIKGRDTRGIMALLEPGDVVMRAYDYYLDGYLFPRERVNAAIAVFISGITR
jgi:hypothetical protein